MSFSGTPCLYYGTEIAMRGKETPFNRSCMPWEDIEAGAFDAFKDKVAALVALRNTLPDFKQDVLDFTYDDAHPRLVCYRKGKVTVILNAGEEAVDIRPTGKVLFANLYDGVRLEKDGALMISDE